MTSPKPPAHEHILGMTHTTWSWIYWGAWLALGFGVAETLAVIRVAPWYTLSETAWNLEAWSHWVSILLLAGLAVLIVHIVFGKAGPAG